MAVGVLGTWTSASVRLKRTIAVDPVTRLREPMLSLLVRDYGI
jgi:hypothetical protein